MVCLLTAMLNISATVCLRKPPFFVIQTHLGSQQLNRVFAIRPVHDRKKEEPVRRPNWRNTKLANE